MGQILGCVRVKPSHVGIKKVSDRYGEVLQPGCHFVPWYFGHDFDGTISMGFNHFNVPVQAKTKDSVYVTVQASIQYQLLEDMAVEAHYQLWPFKDSATYISRYVSRAIKGIVTTMDLDSVFQQKSEIEAAVQKELGEAKSALKFEIYKTFILDIKLEETVKKAMTDGVKLRVETKEKAEAAAESKYLVGLGMSRQFQAITDGVTESKLAFPENVPDATSAT